MSWGYGSRRNAVLSKDFSAIVTAMADDDDRTSELLDRFLTGLGPAVPLVALWAHGSLVMGDYQPGRSDLDMIAVVGAELSDGQKDEVTRLHQRLIEEFPQATKLHCSYLVRSRLADTTLPHVTFAHSHLFERPVTPVARRELLTGDRALYGPSPAELLPPVGDEELKAFVRADLAGVWRPATRLRLSWIWLRDVWVDLGPVTLARAAVTLRDGRLITKGEALDVLAELGAPQEVIADIRARRYGPERPVSWVWRLRRAWLARTFVRAGIDRTLAGA
jgi:hypothetical protein